MKYGFTISVVAMIALVGFELLISQKLQYVYQFSPLQAGLYILPFMIAVSVGGVISTPLLNKFGAKKVAVVSLILSSVSMYFLSVVNTVVVTEDVSPIILANALAEPVSLNSFVTETFPANDARLVVPFRDKLPDVITTLG